VPDLSLTNDRFPTSVMMDHQQRFGLNYYWRGRQGDGRIYHHEE